MYPKPAEQHSSFMTVVAIFYEGLSVILFYSYLSLTNTSISIYSFLQITFYLNYTAYHVGNDPFCWQPYVKI